MPSINQLRRRVKVLKKKRDKELEEEKLRKELFALKHGRKVRVVKQIGKGFAVMGRGAGKVLGDIAENQRQQQSRKRGRKKQGFFGDNSLF